MYVDHDGSLFDVKLHSPVPECASAYECFVDTILGNMKPIATGEEGVIVMELLDAIYKSAKTGKPVQIK